MRKLVLYSDRDTETNRRIDRYLLELLNTTDRRIGYISSSSDPQRQYFSKEQNYYKQYGLELTNYVELDIAYQPEAIEDLFSCDAIHLSGGNTYYFSYWLKQRGLIERLQNYARDGGILIGVSAGAILMTPEISSAKLCGDEPYKPLRDDRGLNLVDFAFVPHLQDTPEYYDRLQSYADRLQRVLYGCHDGDGIVVTGEKISSIGNVVTITPNNI